MASSHKQGKLVNLVNFRMKVTMADGRHMIGQMLAFDKHMNLVLADTEEFRVVKRKAQRAAPGTSAMSEVEEKRTMGLVILRGANVVSLTVEGPPPADPSARLGASGGPTIGSTLAAGGGLARPIGRGVPTGGSLQGPAPGVGGPGGPGFPPAVAPFPPFAGRGGPPGAPGFPSVPPSSFPIAPGAPGAPGGGPPGGFPGAPGGPPGYPGQGRGNFPPGGFPR